MVSWAKLFSGGGRDRHSFRDELTRCKAYSGASQHLLLYYAVSS